MPDSIIHSVGMGTLYKPTRVRWFLDGKQVKPHTPGSQKITEEQKKWCGKVKVNGQWLYKSLAENRIAAAKLLREWERDLTGESPDGKIENQLIEPLVCEFIKRIEAKGRSRKHLQGTRKCIDLGLDGAVTWNDIDEALLLKNLTRYRTTGTNKLKPISYRRMNAIIQSCKSFCEWICTKNDCRNPLAQVEGYNIKEDVRHKRRIIERDEFEKLEKYLLETDSHRNGLSSKRRLALYYVAVMTGWRVRALLSLEWDQINWKECSISATAKQVKNKREQIRFIPEAMMVKLRSWMGPKQSEKVFGPTSWNHHAAMMLQDDCNSVGIKRETRDGIIDFHCLRNTGITWLLDQGTPLTVVQQFADHSTPELTSKYARHKPTSADDAVGKLFG